MSYSQTYSFSDFVGTWNGTYSSEWNYYDNEPITMIIYEDGFYTETFGYFMPSTYPNTQQCEYDSETNRFHWWYLSSVYAGISTYQHIYIEVVTFDDNYIEMHYNFWNDPEPNPEAGTLILYKESEVLESPINLDIDLYDDIVNLIWEMPVNFDENSGGFQNFNIYGRSTSINYSLIGTTEETFFSLEDYSYAGLSFYYVTAVYDGDESEASDEISILFDTPAPEDFYAQNESNSVYMQWSAPTSSELPIATHLGYNIYHKYEEGEYDMIHFTEYEMFNHEYLEEGSHKYYVTALYEGGESPPGEEIEVTILILGIDGSSDTYSNAVYPNPASDFVNINSTGIIENVSIYNHLGQMIKTSSYNQDNIIIRVDDLPAGSYLIRVQSVSGSFSERIVIH